MRFCRVKGAQRLLAQDFAFATSSYHKNGAAIEQARNDLNDLLAYFKTLIAQGSLQNVLLIGASEGGLIAVELLERNPNNYDGALALCGSIGGSLQQIHYAYDFRVVFDYFFPTVFTFAPGEPGEKHFGAFDVPENAYLFWENVYKPLIITALTNDPQSAAQLFRISGGRPKRTEYCNRNSTCCAVVQYFRNERQHRDQRRDPIRQPIQNLSWFNERRSVESRRRTDQRRSARRVVRVSLLSNHRRTKSAARHTSQHP